MSIEEQGEKGAHRSSPMRIVSAPRGTTALWYIIPSRTRCYTTRTRQQEHEHRRSHFVTRRFSHACMHGNNDAVNATGDSDQITQYTPVPQKTSFSFLYNSVFVSFSFFTEYVMKSFLILSAFCCFAFIAELSATTPPATGKEATSQRPQYVISVTQGGKALGDIVVELFPDIAPKHAHNFDSLVSIKFYDGTAFHRVIPGFMIQGGDPNSKSKPRETWGMGDPSQTRVPAEFNKTKHERGVLSAARSSDPNSAASQFFICVGDASWLDGQYSAFGKVVSGLDVVDKVVSAQRDGRNNPLEKIEMKVVKKTSSKK